MISLTSLALIIFMEARSEPIEAQHLVARAVIERSNYFNQPIQTVLNTPKTYSFMWDGKPNTIRWNNSIELAAWNKAVSIANEELNESSFGGRIFFNECKLGKRFPTKYKMIQSGNLCFY